VKRIKEQTQLPLVPSEEMSAPAATSPLALECRTVTSTDPLEAGVDDRQARVPGFSQDALSGLTVLLVGAGALGGEIAEGLVRKGVGVLKILDFDVVAVSNLNRQFFFASDLYHSKAWALARNLAPHGALGTRIIAWNLSFEQAQKEAVDLDCDVVVSAVDDAGTRAAIIRFALEREIPALFCGASVTADGARVFVQEPGKACFACAFPDEAGDGRSPCPGSPAIKDLFKTLAGIALYAIDSLVMDRLRTWQIYTFCPSDAKFTHSGPAKRRADCPFCGGA
jgi:molybdopterin/thiamine biosynthesis adenylyltransferase